MTNNIGDSLKEYDRVAIFTELIHRQFKYYLLLESIICTYSIIILAISWNSMQEANNEDTSKNYNNNFSSDNSSKDTSIITVENEVSTTSISVSATSTNILSIRYNAKVSSSD